MFFPDTINGSVLPGEPFSPQETSSIPASRLLFLNPFLYLHPFFNEFELLQNPLRFRRVVPVRSLHSVLTPMPNCFISARYRRSVFTPQSYEPYGTTLSFTTGTETAASNNPNVNTSVSEAIDTYCFPSKLKVIGDAVSFCPML